MQEKVEEYPLMSKLHLNGVLVWICGLRLWQKVDLEGSHIHIFHPVVLFFDRYCRNAFIQLKIVVQLLTLFLVRTSL